MAHKQQGYRFENDWEMDFLKGDAENLAAGVVIPVQEEIQTNNTVLNYERVKTYLDRSKKIALGNCACRSTRKHCDSPVDTCLALNNFADESLKKGFWKTNSGFVTNAREITKEEALEVIKRGHDAGLVSMAYITVGDPQPYAICQCCSCCCAELGLTLRFGLAPHLLKSMAITNVDEKKCVSCGKCVDRCHFGARKMVDGKMVYDKDLCFGCGLCVSTCPEKAISLKSFG